MDVTEEKIRKIVRDEVKACLPEIIRVVGNHFSLNREMKDRRQRRRVKPENILRIIKDAPAPGVKKTQVAKKVGCSPRQVYRYMKRFHAVKLYILEVEPAKARANVGGKGRSYYPKNLTNKADLILKNVHKLPESWLSELEKLTWTEFSDLHKIYRQL